MSVAAGGPEQGDVNLPLLRDRLRRVVAGVVGTGLLWGSAYHLAAYLAAPGDGVLEVALIVGWLTACLALGFAVLGRAVRGWSP